ncbi:MAG: group II intron reverse transcriptase/maturase, partial [Terriglobia bacterium]
MGTQGKKQNQEGHAAIIGLNPGPKNGEHSHTKNSLNSVSTCLKVVDTRRVGDPRLISLIRRWLKANILEEGELHPNEEGTPQGGSISVLLSNVYLHYVLDVWFERVVKP